MKNVLTKGRKLNSIISRSVFCIRRR